MGVVTCEDRIHDDTFQFIDFLPNNNIKDLLGDSSSETIYWEKSLFVCTVWSGNFELQNIYKRWTRMKDIPMKKETKNLWKCTCKKYQVTDFCSFFTFFVGQMSNGKRKNLQTCLLNSLSQDDHLQQRYLIIKV